MKTKIYFSVILIALFISAGCKKSDPIATYIVNSGSTGGKDATDPGFATAPGLYAAINLFSNETVVTFSQATLLKNDAVITLSEKWSTANAIAVKGKDVYIAGDERIIPNEEKTIACYWKNSTMVKLSDINDNTASAKAITTQGNDIYIAGDYSKISALRSAVYWKNGSITVLPATTGMANAYDIAIVGNDVYVCGTYSLPDLYSEVTRPCYWKNGVLIPLIDNSASNGAAYSIVVNGNDVYICGYTTVNSRRAVYWKNGAINFLPTQLEESVARSIKTNGTDIYIGGAIPPFSPNFSAAAMYWKNGIECQVNNLDAIYSVLLQGNDLYLGGGFNKIFGYSDAHDYAAITKNNLSQILLPTRSVVKGMALVQ